MSDERIAGVPSKTGKLVGARCTVRPWRLQDALALPGIANDPDVARYLTHRFPNPYRLHDAQAWVRVNQSEPVVNFAIEGGGMLAGGIGLSPGTGEHAGSAMIGYWLGRAFWGHGIATEALVMVTRHAFASLRPHRLWANVMAPNRASVRVLEKAGYAHEATLRRAIVDRYGGIHDELVYVRFSD